MSLSWDEIENSPGFAGARARAERELIPILEQVKTDPLDPDREKRAIIRGVTTAFFGFGATFMTLDWTLPQGGAWEALRFFLFPTLFLSFMAGALFLMRGRLSRVLVEAQARLGLKADAMQHLVGPLGITYVPAPGGAPKGLEWLAARSWAPVILRETASKLNALGGMDAAVAIVRDSGLLVDASTYVLGSPEQKAEYARQSAGMQQIEDGFEGRRSGLSFSMFEWVETVEDAPNVYHLEIVLDAAFPLRGVTQLKARKAAWPQDPSGARLQDVDLGPKAFDALYQLRSADQVEARAIFNPAVIERVIALAHGGGFRAVARGQHLVFDFPGEANRFQLVDLVTGVWSGESLRRTHADLAEAVSLVDALGHAFMLARKSDTPGA